METIERINDIGRDNRCIQETLKVLDLTIVEKRKAYNLALAFENDFGIYSNDTENLESDLERLKAEKAMRQMQLMENNKILLTMLTFEITRNENRLN